MISTPAVLVMLPAVAVFFKSLAPVIATSFADEAMVTPVPPVIAVVVSESILTVVLASMSTSPAVDLRSKSLVVAVIATPVPPSIATLAVESISTVPLVALPALMTISPLVVVRWLDV